MKIFTGIVISTKMPKTATVEVERFLSHPVYKKRFKRSKKYQVHTEREVKVGDRVKFINTKPISKSKKWIILEDAKKETAKITKTEKVKEAVKTEKKTKTTKAEKKGKK